MRKYACIHVVYVHATGTSERENRDREPATARQLRLSAGGYVINCSDEENIECHGGGGELRAFAALPRHTGAAPAPCGFRTVQRAPQTLTSPRNRNARNRRPVNEIQRSPHHENRNLSLLRKYVTNLTSTETRRRGF